ncbi:MAG: 2-oxo acid dehydrogenase subunit E2 [Burkholderiales bacterium]|nr:2-oxo acid dehydrogenase subunit E2 [Phycisphaerae bacterium]
MPAQITMPQLSDTMTEGTLVKWLIKEGDSVKAGQIVAEVETDKATMEMESFEAGTLAAILVPAGGRAAVGASIAIVAKAGESVEDAKKGAQKDAQKDTRGAASSAASEAPAKAQAAESSAPVAASASTSTATLDAPTRDATNGHSERIKASPLARRIAADLGVDLSIVSGTGPGGRIVQNDVLGHSASASTGGAAGAKAGQSSPMPQRLAGGEVEKIPLTKMRATIASRLQQAKQQIPHIYVSIDIDMEAVASLREKLNQQLEAEKIRISVADFIAKACATALKKHPGVNAHFDDKNNQIIRYGDVHLGSAVALPDGLIVPVLRSIDQMGWKEIRVRSADLFDRAKRQKLKREEMSGATFTITNLGLWGVTNFQAIVNPPEVAILAVAAAEKRAVVRDGQVVARSTMTVTLSTDHRAVDGALAADFLKTLKGLLEEPALMLV